MGRTKHNVSNNLFKPFASYLAPTPQKTGNFSGDIDENGS